MLLHVNRRKKINFFQNNFFMTDQIITVGHRTKVPDISTHCPSMCHTNLTKWLDENALSIVKQDSQKVRQMPSDEGYVREIAAQI